jgi:hypothetical protein
MNPPYIDQKLKHLEFIQNVITRMNTNSFLIKGWATTIVSALFALAAKDADFKFAIISYFAVPLFWILDAYFLSQERQYRGLYNKVAQVDEGTTNTDFSMNASEFNEDKNTWSSAFWSKKLKIFYWALLGITAVVMAALYFAK